MDDQELLRYSRHVLLEEFGVDGQARVSAAHALVVGAGGLGSPVLLYLAAAGVGRITLIDDDEVDLTNLQRQIAHATERIGMPKVDSATLAMRDINPGVVIDARCIRADEPILHELLPTVDVVVDCSDSFATRQAVNRVCVAHATPLVAGAAIRFDGQLSVYDRRNPASPCYACLFPPDADFEETRCAVLGVFAPVVGTIGALQAHETLKVIAGIEPSLVGTLLMFDGRRTAFDTMLVGRDPDCAVCGPRASLSRAG